MRGGGGNLSRSRDQVRTRPSGTAYRLLLEFSYASPTNPKARTGEVSRRRATPDLLPAFATHAIDRVSRGTSKRRWPPGISEAATVLHRRLERETLSWESQKLATLGASWCRFLGSAGVGRARHAGTPAESALCRRSPHIAGAASASPGGSGSRSLLRIGRLVPVDQGVLSTSGTRFVAASVCGVLSRITHHSFPRSAYR